MTSPRERILASIRRGLVRAGLPADASGSSPLRSAPFAPLSPFDMAEQFASALTALSGHVHRAAGASSVADLVAAIAHEHGAPSFISWDEAHLGCPGLLAALSSRGLSRVAYDVSGDEEPRAQEVDRLATIRLGVTGAYAALADTGGVVLVSGPGRGRLASLLPPVHVAVVEERRLRPSLAGLLREEPGLFGTGSNVVIIAGPSRTADIEMIITRGVHGPKRLCIVLLP